MAYMGLLLLQVFVEEADLEELAKTQQESQAEMDKHLADTNAVLDTMRDEVSLKPALFALTDHGIAIYALLCSVVLIIAEGQIRTKRLCQASAACAL